MARFFLMGFYSSMARFVTLVFLLVLARSWTMGSIWSPWLAFTSWVSSVRWRAPFLWVSCHPRRARTVWETSDSGALYPDGCLGGSGSLSQSGLLSYFGALVREGFSFSGWRAWTSWVPRRRWPASTVWMSCPPWLDPRFGASMGSVGASEVDVFVRGVDLEALRLAPFDPHGL